MPSKSSSRTLTDHDEIRRWAEERDARPSVVRSTHDAESSGIIRLDFPGYSGADSLEEIEWDEWFDDFDRNKLALVVQDETANGEQSNFNKLVSRENVEGYPAESSKRTSATQRKKKTHAINETAAANTTATSPREKSGSAASSNKQRSKPEHTRRSSKKKAA